MDEPAQEVKEAVSSREEKGGEQEDDYEEINSDLFGNDPAPKKEEIAEPVNSPIPSNGEADEKPEEAGRVKNIEDLLE